MTTITFDKIQRDLPGYFHRVQAGETLLITQANQPIAELKHKEQTEKIVLTSSRGKLYVRNDA